MTTLYESNVIDYDDENFNRVDNFYRSEKVVEHKGYKFMYRYIVCNKLDKDERQALYVMVNGKWEFLINSLSVGIKKNEGSRELTVKLDEARNELFKKFEEYIEAVY